MTTPAPCMPNVAPFIGIPYVARGRSRAGADCWGVVLLAARELFGVALPEFFYSDDALGLLPEAEQLIEAETARSRWLPVAPRCGPVPFDGGVVHVFRIWGHPTHVGLHLGGHDFLHSLPGRNACVESLRDGNWVSRRLGSFVYG
jgi:cell wall-associated NlpC family hydrolase